MSNNCLMNYCSIIIILYISTSVFYFQNVNIMNIFLNHSTLTTEEDESVHEEEKKEIEEEDSDEPVREE